MANMLEGKTLTEAPKYTVTTEVLCTWPEDDVTIIQEIRKDGEKYKTSYVALNVREIDQLILDLQKAKAQAEADDQSYRDYCEAEHKHHSEAQ